MFINKPFCKIVATIGPDTSRVEMIEKLVLSGVSVFRFNCSHGSYEEYKMRMDGIRAMEQKYNITLGVLFDLQGPKLRIGRFNGEKTVLKEGQKFTLDMSKELGDNNRVALPHPEIFAAMQDGMELLISDGAIRVRVDSHTETSAQTTVIIGGELGDRKGVNVPGVALPISALTGKDRADLKIAEELGADFIGLSFVQSAEDVKTARSLMTSKASIIAKIEKPAAVDDLRNIIDEADVVMVARGDLGVEVGPEMVPVLQKKILFGCRRAGKPVIVATQMLESMIKNPTPTRAEASDVATAVYEGADAVMLSGETASGKYPIEAVNTMKKIISTVENSKHYKKNFTPVPLKEHNMAKVSDAITIAANVASENIETANLIVNFTDSGRSTIRLSRERPCAPILSLTPHLHTARKMAVVWGARSFIVKNLNTFEDISTEAKNAALASGLAAQGDKIVITAGIPFATSGGTNLLYVVSI